MKLLSIVIFLLIGFVPIQSQTLIVDNSPDQPLDDEHSGLAQEALRFGNYTYEYAASKFSISESTTLTTATFFGEQNSGTSFSHMSVYIFANSSSDMPDGNPLDDIGIVDLPEIPEGSGTEVILDNADDEFDISFDFTEANGGVDIVLEPGDYWMIAAAYTTDADAGDPTISWFWRFSSDNDGLTPLMFEQGVDIWEPLERGFPGGSTLANGLAWQLNGNLDGTIVPTFDFETIYCQNDTPDALSTTSNNGITGIWNPSSINTSIVGTSIYTFTPDAGQNANPISIDVDINDIVTPTFSFETLYCFGDTPDNLPTTSDNGINGTWNPISINTSVEGISDYTFTPDVDQCAVSVTIDVTIEVQVAPNFDFLTLYCMNDTPVDLPTTSDNGINGTWNPSSINTSIVGISGYTFTPNADQCAVSVTIDVTIEFPVVPEFSFAISYCMGDTPADLPTSSDNGIIGIWNPSMISTSNTGITSYSFTPNANECAILVIKDVSIAPLVAPVFSFETTYCMGDTPLFLPATSDNGTTGTWNLSVINTIDVGVTSYIFTPDVNQCALSVTVDITILAPASPIFSISTTYCLGETPADLSTTSNDGITGSWTPSIINTAVDGSSSYTFTPDADQCATMIIIEVDVLSSPEVIVENADNYCEGENIELNTIAAQSWSWEGPNNFSSNEQSPVISDATLLNSGSYTVVVTDDNGCTGSAITMVEINILPIASITGDSFICAGDIGLLSVETCSGCTYLWSPGNETENNIEVATEGNYSVRVTNAEGCSSEESINVTVNPKPLVEIQGNNVICLGSSVSIAIDLPSNSTAVWSTGQITSDIEVGTAGTYSVMVTDINGCFSSDEIEIIESESLEPNIMGSITFCDGESTTLFLNEQYDQYSWTIDGIEVSDNDSLEVDSSVEVGLTVTNNNGCSGSVLKTLEKLDPIELLVDVINPLCYGNTGTAVFSTIGGAGTGYSYSIDGENLIADSYLVTVNDAAGCSTSSMFSIVQPDLIEIDLVEDSYEITGGVEPYVINSIDTIESTQTIFITDANGCEKTEEFIVSSSKYNDIESNITIFPNPTQHTVNFDLGVFKEKLNRVEIINSIGNLIRVVEKGANSFNVRDYPRGLYLIQFHFDTNDYATKKLIIVD